MAKIRRMDHVSINVEDMDAAKDFFLGLGMELVGESKVGGDLVGRIIGLPDPMSDVVFVRTPDGHSQIELVKHLAAPDEQGLQAAPPANRLGLIHIAFEVEDLPGILTDLRAKGYDTVGTVENYEGFYLLCFLRGPEGIIVELAEDISAKK